jgi:hypothetical protein
MIARKLFIQVFLMSLLWVTPGFLISQEKLSGTLAYAFPADHSENPQDNSDSYGNFVFHLPKDWIKLAQPGFLEIVPQPVRELEIFSIILLPGKTSGASLQEELASCWDEFAAILHAEKLREVNGGAYNEEEVSRTFSGLEYISGHGSLRTAADFFVHTYVFRVKDRVERVVVLAKEIRLDAVRSNIDPTVHHYPYYLAITDFIFSLRFSNFSFPDLTAATWKGTGITGIWSGLGFINGRLKTTYVIFFSNGQVFYGYPFPIAGLYNLDSYAESERTKRNWGTFVFQNGQGTIHMPYGSFPVRLDGDQLVMAPISEEHRFIMMPVIDGFRLNGTWSIADANENPVTITFMPDGSFKDRGALRVLDHTVYEYYSITDGGGSGKYTITDYSVLFQYDDGRVFQMAFPGMGYVPGNSSPAELILSYNHDTLVRQ